MRMFNKSSLLFISALMLTSCSNSDDGSLALGTLERDRITLSATAAEVITALPIREGSRVSRGDLLVELDNSLQRTVVAKAEADVQQFEANLEKLRNGPREEEIMAAEARVEAARATLQEIIQDIRRTQRLVDQQLASAAELETAQTRRDARQASMNEAEDQLLLLNAGTRVEDIRLAEAQLNAALSVLDRERQNLENLTVHATRDGILDNLPWNEGERVYMGAPLVILLAEGPPFARVYIPEPVRVQISIGDSLVVRVDGIGQPVTGSVRWISVEPAFTPYYALNREERARLMYLAEIQLPESAADLPSGLPAQVELP
ncbi:MAG: HlyD family efflux transporter periplasmic adaptor subunit [Gammaproteobacteria bacterium]|nr:HlyD family efflux transporter periplasmic adaptor subunit [Gammaproteobacteria bacterium]